MHTRPRPNVLLKDVLLLVTIVVVDCEGSIRICSAHDPWVPSSTALEACEHAIAYLGDIGPFWTCPLALGPIALGIFGVLALGVDGRTSCAPSDDMCIAACSA